MTGPTEKMIEAAIQAWPDGLFDPRNKIGMSAALSAALAESSTTSTTVEAGVKRSLPDIQEIEYKDAFGNKLPSDFVVKAGGVTAKFVAREYAEAFLSALTPEKG